MRRRHNHLLDTIDDRRQIRAGTPPKLADINGNNDRGLRDWRSMTHRHNDTSGVPPEEPERGNARILKKEYLTTRS